MDLKEFTKIALLKWLRRLQLSSAAKGKIKEARIGKAAGRWGTSLGELLRKVNPTGVPKNWDKTKHIGGMHPEMAGHYLKSKNELKTILKTRRIETK